MKKTVFSSILLGVLIFALAGCIESTSSKKSYTSEDIGLRKTALLDDVDVALPGFSYSATPAGESTKFERAFENAPPLIPHDIEGMTDLTRDENICLTCHMPDVAEEVGATAIPKSHFVSMFTKRDSVDEMDQSRFNCTTCHVPQAVGLNPLVKNSFDPKFRDDVSDHKSNLIDIMNEGVK